MGELPDAFIWNGSNLFIPTTLWHIFLESNPNPVSCHSSDPEELCEADSFQKKEEQGEEEKIAILC